MRKSRKTYKKEEEKSDKKKIFKTKRCNSPFIHKTIN